LVDVCAAGLVVTDADPERDDDVEDTPVVDETVDDAPEVDAVEEAAGVDGAPPAAIGVEATDPPGRSVIGEVTVPEGVGVGASVSEDDVELSISVSDVEPSLEEVVSVLVGAAVSVSVLVGAAVSVSVEGVEEMLMLLILNSPDLSPLSPKRTTMYVSRGVTAGTVTSTRPREREKPCARG